MSGGGTRISIAMATYNGERFVAEQLESFVRQERLPDELVVSDDASTDRTVELVRKFSVRAPFPVRLFINDRNLGVAKNFERAIAECAGDIIFLSDQDDYWYPRKILRMEKALSETPQAALAICNSDLVNERLERLGRTSWPPAQRLLLTRWLRKRMAEGRAYRRSIPAAGRCMAFRAKFKPLILPLPPCAGHDLFIVWAIICSGTGGVALIPEPLLAYRLHPSQINDADRQPFFKRLLLPVASRHERPNLLPALIQRVESDCAARLCLNPALRSSVLRHWRARANIPSSVAGRLPVVARELRTLRYHRFSGGILTAAKDLFFVR